MLPYNSTPFRPIAAFIKLVFLLCILAGFGSCQSITRTAVQLDLPEGVVIFSFDDGPNRHGDTTARLLDILKKHEIPAIFALIGENSRHNPVLVQGIRDNGHLLINHGYSAKWAIHMDNEHFYTNLIQGEASFYAVLGEVPLPRLYRPHGGFYTKGQERIWRSAGYALVPATARAYDAVLGKAGRDRVVSEIIKTIEKQGGGIILLHDARDSQVHMETRLAKDPDGVFNRSWIPDVVEELILYLKARGYQLTGFDIREILGL